MMAVLVAVLGGGAGFLYWTSAQYYIGADRGRSDGDLQRGARAGRRVQPVRGARDQPGRLISSPPSRRRRCAREYLDRQAPDARARLDDLVARRPGNVNLLPRCPTPTPRFVTDPVDRARPRYGRFTRVLRRLSPAVVATPVPCRSEQVAEQVTNLWHPCHADRRPRRPSSCRSMPSGCRPVRLQADRAAATAAGHADGLRVPGGGGGEHAR